MGWGLRRIKYGGAPVEEGAESEEDDLGCAPEPGADFSLMAAYLKRDEVGKLMNLEKFSRLHHPSSLTLPPLGGRRECIPRFGQLQNLSGI